MTTFFVCSPPNGAVSRTEDASRTPGGLFAHRMRIPYRRRLFLVRRASENTSHLVVRSTGKRVAVASQRQAAAAAELRTSQKKESGAIPNSLPINFLMLYRPTFGGHIILVDLFLFRIPISCRGTDALGIPCRCRNRMKVQSRLRG